MYYCYLLQLDLNEARGYAGDFKTHSRIVELETYLANTNGGTRFGQGVGFVLLGTVLDRRALKKIALSAYSVLVPALAFVLTTSSSANSGDICNITNANFTDDIRAEVENILKSCILAV